MYKLQLDSPYFQDQSPATFNLSFTGNYSAEAAEIIKIIRFISEGYTDLKDILDRHKTAHTSHDSLQRLIEEYNTWISEHRRECLKKIKEDEEWASPSLIRYLMVLVYNRSILDPDKLNQYEPFSPEVYGETSFDLIESLLERVTIKETDTFMDLGSGVGNIVLHVAASVKCKCCYGFEKAEWPSHFALKMEVEFKYWMCFFGKTFSKFKLYKADFLSDEEQVQRYNPLKNEEGDTITMNEYVKELINEANLVFVNNYAFGAEVDHQLKLRFCNMSEGSLIVSSKPFCSLNFRINSRNLNDIGTILNINEEPLNGKVSWTDRPINYYFHKIDRTLLEKYFERLNNPGEYKANTIDSKHRKSTSSLIISTSSDSAQSSPASSPTSSNSSLNSSGLSIKKVKKLAYSHSKSNDTNPSKSPSAPSKKNKKRKSERSRSPDTSRKSKLLKKDPKKTSSATSSRSKSLDKDALKTLAKMHGQTTKPNKASFINELYAQTDGILAQFNVRSLTTLKDENLDKKLLKDCKISPKLMKSFRKEENSRSHSVPYREEHVAEERLENKSGKMKKLKAKSGGLIEDEEVVSRQNLGVDIINAVDGFLKKMQKQYIKYLMHLKSTSYEEKIKLELKNEKDRNTELVSRKEKLEKLSNSLMKSNVELLKKRVEELGIKNLESPYQLIEYARSIITDNKLLNRKIEIVEKKVNGLNFKQKESASANLKTDSSEDLLEKTSSRLQNLDALLKKIDLKYRNLSSDFLGAHFKIAPKTLEERSVKSDDGTLSATEKNDDDDQNMAELDEELKTIDSKCSGEDMMKTTKKLNKLMSPTIMSPGGGDKYEQLLNGNRSLDGWRSFKIPKQQKTSDETENLKTDKTTTPVGSPTLSTSSSSSSTIRPLDTQASIPRQISHDSTSSSSTNSLYSSSKNLPEIGNTNSQHSNDKQYYHPKKKQFRQYMMENSNPTKPNQQYQHHHNSSSQAQSSKH